MKTIPGTLALILALILALALTAPAAQAEMTDDMAAMAGRQLYAEGRYDEAVAVIRPLAEKGVPRAMAIYGFFFERGLGVAQDNAQAVAWYEKAAAAGSPIGIHNLARTYEIGDLGVAVDLPRARAMYAQAAALDYLPSVHNLARMMIYGEGGPMDTATGLAYLERAVSLGYGEAAADMGYMLATGDGLPVDLARARDLYETGAGHQIDWAMRDFAEMLELGQGGPVDLDRAWFWYARAASADYAMAGVDLAEMVWANPEALADRKVEALAWCYWAEAQPPDHDGTEYEGRCAPGEPAYTAAEIAAARDMAQGL